MKNCLGVRPQQDIQITKPLITKKISTPIQPYAENRNQVGTMSDTGRSQIALPGWLTRQVPA